MFLRFNTHFLIRELYICSLWKYCIYFCNKLSEGYLQLILLQRDYREIYSTINEASANETNSLVVKWRGILQYCSTMSWTEDLLWDVAFNSTLLRSPNYARNVKK
jgi:hypothetical protein